MRSLFVLMGLLLGAAVAEPCVCADKRSVAAEFKAADAVFVGKLEEMSAYERDEWGEKRTLRFSVEKGFKGVHVETVTLMDRNHTSCAFEFHWSISYVVYAFKTTAGELVSHSCSRTAGILKAQEDLEHLPEPIYVREE